MRNVDSGKWLEKFVPLL